MLKINDFVGFIFVDVFVWGVLGYVIGFFILVIVNNGYIF